MRHLLFLLVLLVTGIRSLATPYVVKSNSTVNVREAPTTSSAIVGHLQPGDTIECSSDSASTGEWVQFEGKNTSGFVNSRFLSEVKPQQPDVTSDLKTYTDAFNFFYTNKHWLSSESSIISIRIAMGVLWLIMTGLMFVHIKRGWVFHLNNLVIFILGVLEIIYFLSFGEEAVVFLTKAYQPSAPTILETGLSLLMFFIGYLVVFIMIAVQFVALKNTLVDIAVEYCASFVSFKIGVYSIPIALTASFFLMHVYPVAIKWVLIGFYVCQAIQIGIIIFGLLRKPLAAAMSVLVYAAGIGGIIFAMSSYFWIVILVMLLIIGGMFANLSPFGEMSVEQAKILRMRYLAKEKERERAMRNLP